MKRIYMTEIDKRVSSTSFAYIRGIMVGYFYPEVTFTIGGPNTRGSIYIGVTTTAEEYDGFKKLVEKRLFSDKKAINFDILGGQYE